LTSDSTANWTTFNLGFSNCINPDTNYGIAVTFNYTSFDASNPNLIANSASTGAASNAGVQLALNDGTTIASGTLYTVLANTTNGVTGYTVPLKARMRAATGKTPTAGKVTATATFTVTYQ
jgi:type 1 fimbria pilin